jgi:hypothetical protein
MWHKEQYGTVHTCPFEPYAEYRVLPFSSFPPHLAMAASRNDLFSADCAISRKNKILNLKLADVRKSLSVEINKFHNGSKSALEIVEPANWIRSANEMGPPLEKESISFLASVSKSNAAESPLFSGLLVSGLYLKNKYQMVEQRNGLSRLRNLLLVRSSSA